MTRRSLLPTCALAVLVAACGGDEQETGLSAPPVGVARVQELDVVDHIEATGELLAKEEATVAAQVAGPITRVHVEEGDAVEAGAPLLEIDPERRQLDVRDARAGVAQARADRTEREREAARIRTLGEKGVASRARIDAAETAAEVARSQLAAAQARLGMAERSLRDASVRAPFAGRVARRHVSAGEFVSAGQALFDLVALDPIEVEFHLAEVDSSRVSLGDEVEVRVAPFPDETFDARVTVIAPTIDPRTRTLRVKAEIDNAEGRLRPGLFARADLGVAMRRGVAMVPQEAVLQRADGAVLYVLEGSDHVRRLNVETGVYRDALVEIRRGVAPGRLVVVRGHADLIDGAVVSVRNPDGSPAEVAAQ